MVEIAWGSSERTRSTFPGMEASSAGSKGSALSNNLSNGVDKAPLKVNPTQIPTPTLNTGGGGQRSLPAIKIDPSGKVYTTQILKQQLANELGLPLRDLRIVDPSLPSQIQVTFLARSRAILFSIQNIKVVVQHNEALIFSPYQPEVQEFIPALQQQLSQAILTESIHPDQNVLGTRFEHVVIEAALNSVCNNLFRRVRVLAPAVESTLKGIRAESRGLDVLQTQVDELLPLKNKLDDLLKRVKEMRRAITDLLNNDEDLAMMYLSPFNNGFNIGPTSGLYSDLKLSGGIANLKSSMGSSINSAQIPTPSRSATSAELVNTVPPDLSLEMLLENYLNEVEWIASEIEEVLDGITNTEENVVLQLDLIRNRILRFELLLSVLSFIITCGALVTGLFGMNLLNHFELNSHMFYTVTAFLFFSMIGTFLGFQRYGKRERLF